MIVPHFGSRHNDKDLLPAVAAGGYSTVRLTTQQGSVTVWIAGARSFVLFTIDCKPQPSSDLNIKLQDELQCCLASNEQNFTVKIPVLLLCECQCIVMCGRMIWATLVRTGLWPIHNNFLMHVF